MKNVKIIISLLLIVVVLSSCQGGGAEKTMADLSEISPRPRPHPTVVHQDIDHIAPDIAQIIKKGHIIFGIVKTDHPPFFMRDNQGNLYGIDVEMAEDIAREMGVEVIFDETSENYRELYHKLISGEIDVVAAQFSQTLNRALFINYTESYAEFGRTLVLNKKDEMRLGIKEDPTLYLKNNPSQIAVVKGTSYIEYSQDMFPLAQIVEFDTADEGIEAVIDSRVTAFFNDELELARLVGVQQDILLYTSVYTFDDMRDYISMAVSIQSPNLCRWINIYLQHNNELYTLDRMMDDYPEFFSHN